MGGRRSPSLRRARGFDDLSFADSLGLTAIHHPLEDIGTRRRQR
jgi:hypothetical protein